VTELLAPWEVLDFAALDQRPLTPITAPLAGLDHPHLPRILAAMPGHVRHSRQVHSTREDHSLIAAADASAALIVLEWDRTQARTVASYAHIGPRDLVTELLGLFDVWELAGRNPSAMLADTAGDLATPMTTSQEL
jgi:hypothetical protein